RRCGRDSCLGPSGADSLDSGSSDMVAAITLQTLNAWMSPTDCGWVSPGSKPVLRHAPRYRPPAPSPPGSSYCSPRPECLSLSRHYVSQHPVNQQFGQRTARCMIEPSRATSSNGRITVTRNWSDRKISWLIAGIGLGVALASYWPHEPKAYAEAAVVAEKFAL